MVGVSPRVYSVSLATGFRALVVSVRPQDIFWWDFHGASREIGWAEVSLDVVGPETSRPDIWWLFNAMVPVFREEHAGILDTHLNGDVGELLPVRVGTEAHLL